MVRGESASSTTAGVGRRFVNSRRRNWRVVLYRTFWTLAGIGGNQLSLSNLSIERNIRVAWGLRLTGWIMLAVLLGIEPAQAKQNANCPTITHIKIAVGSTIYSVPRNYDFHVSGGEIPPNFNIRDYCPDDDSSILNVENLTFQRAFDYSSKEYHSNSIPGVQIRVRTSSAPYLKPASRLDIYVNRFAKENISIEKLKLIEGFYAKENNNKSGVYISKNNKTLNEIPKIVECGIDRYFGGKHIGRTCDLGYYEISRSIIIRYVFYDRDYPISLWDELDNKVQNFVENLEINTVEK